ncbi:MAG: amino acid adenylation domain-containing protein, partial [Oscillospiraceae bacterium]|nr:amino acid adenylation domain-containing protein [Oscillospiraceae bacterium]
ADRSIEMIVAIYGTLKSGGAYLPIDPTYPEERISFMLEDSKPKAVLTYTSESLNISDEISVIDLGNKELYDGPSENPEHVNTANDLAYCIYTSGTTGRPKGVMIENSSLVNLIINFMSRGYDGTVKNAALLASYAFDASIKIIITTPLCGKTLHIISEDKRFDMNSLLRYYSENRIDLTDCTPTHLRMMRPILQSIKYGEIDLNRVYVGGEELSTELAEDVLNTNFCGELINVYGPTECTVNTTSFEINKNTEKVYIGKPLANYKVYILDGIDICGIGIPGELCITGDGIARGYLNRPELTAEKFVKNPFGDGRMYRTGDLARWLPDGNIEYLGRIDEQVKIRGFRIELGEIESRIREIESIKDCAVTAREDSAGDKAIYAYYTSDVEVSVSEIRDRLSASLPEYMLPAYMMQIESIPVTRNGKLDKRALPEIEARTGREYIAPVTETQKLICEIFGEILGVEKVGIKDSFFEMGGHSLRATRLVNSIEAKTGARIALKEVFTSPTPEQLAQIADSKSGERYEAIPKAEEKEYYPMSSTQKRVYLVTQMDSAGLSYNMPIAVKLTGRMDIEKVQNAFQALIDRHEILRTGFGMEEGELVQLISEAVLGEVEYDEKINTDEEAIKECFTDFLRPFDLSQAPLMRIKVVKTGEAEQYLFFDMHHIISDGMSMNIVIEEFSRLYNGESLEALRVQYKDYSEWMQTRDLSKQASYWKEQFAEEAPVLDMPTDYPRPQVQSYCGSREMFKLAAEETKELEELCQRTGATEYMVFLSALMITLSKYSRQDDIVIGSPISGRTHRDTETMLGMFVNTLAMRGRPEGKKTVRAFLAEMKDVCLKSYENQDYPFEELIEAVEVRRDVSRNPLFDVMLVLQNNENVPLKLNGLDVMGGVPMSEVAKFDLGINVSKISNEYVISTGYCTDLYKPETIQWLNRHFKKAIRCMAV